MVKIVAIRFLCLLIKLLKFKFLKVAKFYVHISYIIFRSLLGALELARADCEHVYTLPLLLVVSDQFQHYKGYSQSTRC